jgi:glycerophosphoryl diester phosphodiesterase
MKIRYKSIISFASLAAIAPVMLSITSCNRNDIEYIAHRGLSSTFFQNTAASFAAAGQNSFFSAIETDIYLTKDYHIVCVHDENPFRDPTSLLHERSKDLVKDMNLEEAIARTL